MTSAFDGALLDDNPDALLAISTSGEVLHWNQGATAIFGYSGEEATGRLLDDLIVPPDCVDEERRYRERAEQHGAAVYESVRRRKDGVLVHVNVTTKAIRDTAGAVRYFLSTKKDVTHLKVLRDAKLVEAKFRDLLESTPDAIVMVNVTGRIVLVNAQAESVFGYARAELLGQPVEMLLPARFHAAHHGHRGAFFAQPRTRTMGAGLELYGLRKNGREFPVEISLSPLATVEGTMVMSAVRDITDRRQAEQKFRSLLEAAPDAMVIIDSGGRITLVNSQTEKLFGYPRDELLGEAMEILVPERFRARHPGHRGGFFAQPHARAMGEGLELYARRKDGSEFPVEISLSPLDTVEGMLAMSTIRDISVRKKTEAHLLQKVEELNRSNEELAQFAALASHDLQEPLRMVASYTQLLSRRYKGKLDAEADEFIAFAVDGATRMQLLIQDLLAYSRVSSSGRELLAISSKAALDQALINLRGAIEESGALVTNDTLPAVLADQTQLVQLFQNLIGNAIKYQNPGIPRVHVSAANGRGQQWIFSVKDNGLGIEAQYLQRIFGMFQRLHKREEFAGTGIGLAICKKIVERHGGRISVESQIGKGSTFRFALAGSESEL
jgi:protein-histidine pros-kinase